MESTFTIFRLAESLNDIPLRIILKKYRSKKAINKYILKKVPLKLIPIQILDTAGFDVMLPLTLDMIKTQEEQYIKDVIRESIVLMQEENSIVFSFPNEVKEYAKDLDVFITDNNSFPFFVMDKIIEKSIRYSDKSLKNMHFVIIDGTDTLTDYCLDIIYNGINHLAIITERPTYFENKSNEIFEETGLIVELKSPPLLDKIESDIVINCNPKKDKNFYYFSKKSIIIDFISSNQEIRNILIKRSDLRIVDKIAVKVNGVKLDEMHVQAALLVNNRSLRRWLFHGYTGDMLDKIKRIIKEYEITVTDFYQYGRKWTD